MKLRKFLLVTTNLVSITAVTAVSCTAPQPQKRQFTIQNVSEITVTQTSAEFTAKITGLQGTDQLNVKVNDTTHNFTVSSLNKPADNEYKITITGLTKETTYELDTIKVNNDTSFNVKRSFTTLTDVTTTPPGTENPGTENPGTENPGTENPGTENPGTENPGTENPGTENPGTENPGTENPGTENPGTENPGTENPGTENPRDTTPPVQEPDYSQAGEHLENVTDEGLGERFDQLLKAYLEKPANKEEGKLKQMQLYYGPTSDTNNQVYLSIQGSGGKPETAILKIKADWDVNKLEGTANSTNKKLYLAEFNSENRILTLKYKYDGEYFHITTLIPKAKTAEEKQKEEDEKAYKQVQDYVKSVVKSAVFSQTDGSSDNKPTLTLTFNVDIQNNAESQNENKNSEEYSKEFENFAYLISEYHTVHLEIEDTNGQIYSGWETLMDPEKQYGGMTYNNNNPERKIEFRMYKMEKKDENSANTEETPQEHTTKIDNIKTIKAWLRNPNFAYEFAFYEIDVTQSETSNNSAQAGGTQQASI